MTDGEKAKQLRSHKTLATALFVAMVLVYAATHWWMRSHHDAWLGYVNAFAEAAMVGALADWFAVTALFHHPLGIPIPHTNLIENRKKAIGDNLGSFVVSNFLTAANIRPYINKIQVASFAGQWLSREKNRNVLLAEMSRLMNDIIRKMDDEMITQFLARKAKGLVGEMPLHSMLANGLEYFLQRGEHQKFITVIAYRIRQYIVENDSLVREKVRQESSFFIPRFVDNKLARKISDGLMSYFEEVEKNENHHLRREITEQLFAFASLVKTEPSWQEELEAIKSNVFTDEKIMQYTVDTWRAVKTMLQRELSHKQSALMKYFARNMEELADNLQQDIALQKKIDGWVRFTAYKYILRNAASAGSLISNTVGNWPGRQLSRKLELEVGKDLQYIRINGTVVGGLVGLFIYVVTKFFS